MSTLQRVVPLILEDDDILSIRHVKTYSEYGYAFFLRVDANANGVASMAVSEEELIALLEETGKYKVTKTEEETTEGEEE